MKIRKMRKAIPAKPKKVTLDNFQIIEVNDNQNDNLSEFGYENLNVNTDSNSPNKCPTGNVESIRTYSLKVGSESENLNVCTNSDPYFNCLNGSIQTKMQNQNFLEKATFERVNQIGDNANSNMYYEFDDVSTNEHVATENESISPNLHDEFENHNDTEAYYQEVQDESDYDEEENNFKKSQLNDHLLVKQEIQKNTQMYYSLQKSDPNQHTRIIRGDFHQGDGRFVELSRGKQCVAVSIVVLCFFKINNSPATWTTVDINNILINGDIQYHASYQKLKREGKTPEAKHLLISDVYPYIKFGRQYFSFNGMKNVFDYLNVEKDVFNLINLERSLNRFFNENKNECGVFACNIYSFAIMRKSNSFFLFNPYATSYAGEPMNPNDKESAACLMEMFTIMCLANHLLETCRQEQSIFDDSECDASIWYSLTNLSVEKEVFGKDILKRRRINRDLCKAECNRGGIKRKLKPELIGHSEEPINRRQKREHIEKDTFLNQPTMQNQNDFLEKATFNRVDQIGDGKSSINIDYEFDNVSTNGHVATENESISPNLHDESENQIDNGDYCQEVEDESQNIDEENNILSGRRIVDIGFLFEQMKYINRHSDNCDSQMVFRKETKLGFRSIFHFECADCGVFHQIQSSSKNDDYMNVNKAATLGFFSVGSGFYHMQEVCAHLNIPCMSSSTFEGEHKKLQNDWSELSKHHTEKALLEGIRLAIARGDVDSAGNALIPVIYDGSWGKRSYGKGFSSLSGCAAIIGVHTKKVLYFGVKNKYCHTCTLSYAKFCPPNYHDCNINYVGPSSGMETEILVEGLQFCERLGARFHQVISDGDSSAFKEITERCIYQNPDVQIEKFECVNHLYKNARKKFTALCSNTKFKLDYRKLLKHSMADDLCKGIRSAANHWRESNVDMIQKLENLERDCLNAPYHFFGNHDHCDEYFCKKTTTQESNANIDLLKSCGLFHEIMSYCNSYFAGNVKSLLQNQTNNAAEELNSVIAKYLGGKRINYSLAGSYTARVSAAVVQYNSKGHAGSQFHQFHSINPINYCSKIENSRKNHYAKNEVARQMKPRKKATRDKNVKGYKAQKEDLSERALEVAMNIELAKLDTNRINRDVILKKTFDKKYNLKWKEIRKKLVNCNYFGRIINAKSPKSYTKLLEEMLNNPMELGNTAEVRHQRLYELEALNIFSQLYKDYKLEKTGIFIDEELSFLGASPLRLYGPDSIVNVQCPVKAFRTTVDHAISKNWLPFTYKNGDVIIKETSNWYIEVQGELHITGRNLCYLVVWLGTEFIIKKVTVNHSFWNTKMKKKLEFFFKEAMLKELANSRKARKMDLRQYDPQTNQFV